VSASEPNDDKVTALGGSQTFGLMQKYWQKKLHHSQIQQKQPPETPDGISDANCRKELGQEPS
jgi:hypothetical protein